MYVEKPKRTAAVKLWADSIRPGVEYDITESGRAFCATLPPYQSIAGYRGQTVARILCEHCGWIRGAWTVRKPKESVSPDEV